VSCHTAFQRARLRAAEPLPAVKLPTITVAVSPELIAALAASVKLADLEPAQRFELECVLLQAQVAKFRQRAS
jgi:hypothetical protein